MGFLEHVLAEKEKEIAQRMLETPREELERIASREPVRDFFTAIDGRGRIIAEIKRRSPNVPRFRSSSIVDELPLIYEQNGAAALSVVVDTPNFGITLEEARDFRSKTSLPMLVKDFFIDPYQVVAARAFHADAILFIAAILSAGKLASLLALACELRMHAIVEVHTEADIEQALAVGVEIIGINNRNLDSLDVDTGTTRALLPRIPAGALIVSESGINSRKQVESLVDAGVHALLIGGALLDAHDPGRRLRELAGGVDVIIPHARSDEEQI